MPVWNKKPVEKRRGRGYCLKLEAHADSRERKGGEYAPAARQHYSITRSARTSTDCLRRNWPMFPPCETSLGRKSTPPTQEAWWQGRNRSRASRMFPSAETTLGDLLPP